MNKLSINLSYRAPKNYPKSKHVTKCPHEWDQVAKPATPWVQLSFIIVNWAEWKGHEVVTADDGVRRPDKSRLFIYGFWIASGEWRLSLGGGGISGFDEGLRIFLDWLLHIPADLYLPPAKSRRPTAKKLVPVLPVHSLELSANRKSHSTM